MFLESSKGPNLVVYEKLYTFLQIFRYSSDQDREVIEKLLEINKFDPDRALSLVSSFLLSTMAQEETNKLQPKLEQILTSEKSEANMNYYSF